MLDEVLIPGSASLHSDTSPVLGLVLGEGCPLDIAQVGNRNHHILIGIEVLRIEFIRRECYLSPSCITVLLLHLHGLILDDAHLKFLTCKDFLAIMDEFHLLVVLILELFPFKSRELTQPHLYDGSSLCI